MRPCRASSRAAKLQHQAPTPRGKENPSFQTPYTETLERSFRKETERRLGFGLKPRRRKRRDALYESIGALPLVYAVDNLEAARKLLLLRF